MPKNPHLKFQSIVDDTATIILAGGQGSRLFPLTQTRCKPAVSFGGRYRLIDIPISNSLNSRIPQIYVISQYFSSGLNHHIKETFQLDHIQGGSMEFFYPEETSAGQIWYKGTADAIRQNLTRFAECPCEYFLILSGDQLYNMDLYAMVQFSKEKNADLTIATLPVHEHNAKRMGLLKINEAFDVLDFYEKPTDAAILKQYALTTLTKNNLQLQTASSLNYLGSMGIYVFKKQALIKLLQEDPREDFGKHLIPTQIKKGNTASFFYNGYWEDIGTIHSYYEANLALTSNKLGLDLYNESLPIFTTPINLPCARLKSAMVTNSILCQGSIIDAAEVSNSVIGLRSHIHEGSRIKDSIIIGNAYYTPPASLKDNLPDTFSIGKHCILEKCIVDEHTKIGHHVKLINKKNLMHFDGQGIFIRDGIIIVTSGTTLPDGFEL